MSKSQLDDLTRDRRYGVFIELEGRSIAVIHGNHELWSGGKSGDKIQGSRANSCFLPCQCCSRQRITKVVQFYGLELPP